MCRFLSLDVNLEVRCPVDKTMRAVTFQASPWLRGHGLEVVACDARPRAEISCGKACRALLESGSYWQTIYADAAG